MLYNYVYWHELHHRWKDEDAEYLNQNLRYFRIAAANGDVIANVRLQSYLVGGELSKEAAPDKLNETLDLNDLLLAQNLPLAYYRKGTFILYGYYKGSRDDAWAYIRKAADMGDKDAQFDIGRTVAINTSIPAIKRWPYLAKLWECAAMQGHAEAAFALEAWGDDGFSNLKDYLAAFHNGAKGGEPMLFAMIEGFNYIIPITNKTRLGLTAAELDPERAERYHALSHLLTKYSYLGSKLKIPDLDKIVLLPPAKLPEWDGKTAFIRWYLGAEPPKPSEELMQQLAEKHHLDPATGLPLNKKKR
ncbi:MAG: DUF6396 domain-containing protein [Pasteurellaceae bacterium]|nr:DUF6396 domain-containing protein [Pasteurellaceae bacterium]